MINVITHPIFYTACIDQIAREESAYNAMMGVTKTTNCCVSDSIAHSFDLLTQFKARMRVETFIPVSMYSKSDDEFSTVLIDDTVVLDIVIFERWLRKILTESSYINLVMAKGTYGHLNSLLDKICTELGQEFNLTELDKQD